MSKKHSAKQVPVPVFCLSWFVHQCVLAATSRHRHAGRLRLSEHNAKLALALSSVSRLDEIIGQVRENTHKPMAILLIIVKDSLPVYSSHHHMIDAISAFLSRTPGHGIIFFTLRYA